MCDLDYRNINLLTFFKTGRENLSCHFPRREIHDSDYYNVFLKFVFKNISDLEIHIEKSDVEKAFEENADFVMCLLGYEKMITESMGFVTQSRGAPYSNIHLCCKPIAVHLHS